MAHPYGTGNKEDSEDKWDRMRREHTEFLKTIGQEYPICGFSCGDGWKGPIYNALRKIAEVGIPWKLTQVKQKFCQLRIYVDFPDQEAMPMVVDFISPDGVQRVDVAPETKTVCIWQEEHPEHHKFLQIQKIISHAESICDVTCEDCGASTEGGAASGWKGCATCKQEELDRFRKEGY